MFNELGAAFDVRMHLSRLLQGHLGARLVLCTSGALVLTLHS